MLFDLLQQYHAANHPDSSYIIIIYCFLFNECRGEQLQNKLKGVILKKVYRLEVQFQREVKVSMFCKLSHQIKEQLKKSPSQRRKWIFYNNTLIKTLMILGITHPKPNR